MAKPTIMTVDDDHEVLRAIERDLRRKYGHDYRIMRAESAMEAIETLRQLKLRNAPVALQLKDFLARNQVAYRWMDIETDSEARRLASYATGDTVQLPLVLLQDGTALIAPTPAQLAEKIGFRMRAELPFYDLIIVGGGPAGLAAAVYGASEGLKTVLIEREAPGGQAGT